MNGGERDPDGNGSVAEVTRSQPVLTPLTESAILLVLTVETAGVDVMRDLLAGSAGIVRSVGFRDRDGPREPPRQPPKPPAQHRPTVAGVNTLGHGIINAAAAVSYAKTHRHPGVAQDFAPRWYRWTEFTLLAAVIVRYSWALIQMLRRRSAGPLAATVDLAVNVTG